jgi:hypothetical protein
MLTLGVNKAVSWPLTFLIISKPHAMQWERQNKGGTGSVKYLGSIQSQSEGREREESMETSHVIHTLILSGE